MSGSLGDRMKGYENVQRHFLTRRTPVIIRLDGRAFHTFTRGMPRQSDPILREAMWEACLHLCANIMGCKLAYTQSDEISLLLTDYETHETSAWFDNNVLKIVSVSASEVTMAFNRAFGRLVSERLEALIEEFGEKSDEVKKFRSLYLRKVGIAVFDSRAFTVPKEEVTNYFLWRQQDATRNAIEALGQTHFSAKRLHKVSCNEIQELLWQEKGINFNDCPVYQKRGACAVRETYTVPVLDNMGELKGASTRSRWVIDENIPIFSQDRDYIESLVYPKEIQE